MNPITETIKSFFDSNNWHYDLELASDSEETNDQADIFIISMNGKHEQLDCKIIIEHANHCLLIMCSPRTHLYPENIPGALQAINEFNLRSKFVIGSITEKGNIIFSLGVYTGGINILSEQTFSIEFDLVTDAADDMTAHIYKKALESTPKKRSLLSFFKK